MDEDNALSDGEIANIVGALREREENPDGAQRLLEELDRRLMSGEPVPANSHLAEYFHWAVGRLLRGYGPDDAFKLTRRPHRPPKNAQRDESIAFRVQRRLTLKGCSEDAAALAVRDMLMKNDPNFDLNYDRIRNIYRQLRDDPLIQAAAKLLRHSAAGKSPS